MSTRGRSRLWYRKRGRKWNRTREEHDNEQDGKFCCYLWQGKCNICWFFPFLSTLHILCNIFSVFLLSNFSSITLYFHSYKSWHILPGGVCVGSQFRWMNRELGVRRGRSNWFDSILNKEWEGERKAWNETVSRDNRQLQRWCNGKEPEFNQVLG